MSETPTRTTRSIMALQHRMARASKRGFVFGCVLYLVIMLDFNGRMFPRLSDMEEGMYVRQLVTEPRLVIYNRMPFSVSLTQLFQSLNLIDKRFDQYSSVNYNNDWLDAKAESTLVSALTEVVRATKHPVLFDRHVRFMDFTVYHEEQPVYLNLVQDPINRIVYQYIIKQHGQNMNNITESLNECLETGGADCTDTYHMTMSYFCGSSEECLAVDEGSLERAKYNIVHNFLLVGIEDEVNNFLWGVEKLLPSYFDGIIQEVEYQETQDVDLLERKRLPDISNSTRQLIIERQRYDYEIYLFAKQRFHAIVRALQHRTLKYVTHEKLSDAWFERHTNIAAEDRVLTKYGYLDRKCKDCIRSMTKM